MSNWVVPEQLRGGWFVAVDIARVNMDDLVKACTRPGGVVRCYGNPNECIKLFADESSALDFIAGMISEDV